MLILIINQHYCRFLTCLEEESFFFFMYLCCNASCYFMLTDDGETQQRLK